MIKDIGKESVKDIVSLSNDFIDAWKEDMYLNQSGLKIKGEYDGDKLLGFIAYAEGLDFTDLEIIYVDKEFRRQGIGAKLIDEMIKDAKTPVYLEVRESNLSAITLYKAKGFTFLNKRKKYYTDGEDCSVFVKA